MDDAEKQALRTRMQEALAQVRRDVETLEVATQPIPPDRALGRLTRMEGLNDRAVSEAALQSARQRLVQLEESLQRIDSTRWGLCVRCGNPIGAARLEYMPESDCCVKCAS
jgi:DnaK suppressor protein